MLLHYEVIARMNKIDIMEWRNFKLGDLFDIHPTKAYKMNNSTLLEDDAHNPVVVNSSYNNGVGGYTNQECTEKGNMITFSDTTSADSIFYQEKEFVGYPHVQGLYPFEKNKWTKYSYLFLVTIFREKAKNLNYDYVNKFTRESAREILLKLPIDENGNINFKYMEDYMKEIEKTVQLELEMLKNCHKEYSKCNTEQWKGFKIGDLFEIKRPAARSQSNYEDGDIPFVASGNYNNGVIKYLKPNQNELLDKGNCITVSPVDGSAFYQKNDFLGRGGAGSSIILLYNDNINENNGCFLASVIRKVCSKYMYGDMGNKETIKQETIMLPAKDDNNPDYEFMSQFIKNMRGNLSTKLNRLSKI